MRYAHQQDSLAGLEEDRRGSLPKSGRRGAGQERGGRKWTGSLGQRARASRGLPPAVIKISSFSHSAGAVWDRVNYVGRDGELEVETPDGEKLTQAELEERVEDWSTEAGKGREGRRHAMSAVVSFPEGVDEEKATEVARQFFLEAFADNHDYVFAGHTDAKNFHVHVVVQAAGHDGKQIQINKDDIQAMRMLYAEKAAEQGIELDASPRWARGLEAERQKGLGIEGIERRGETPALSREAGAGQGWNPERELAGAGRLSPARGLQLEALVEVRAEQDPEARGAPTPLEYARAAESLAGKIGGMENTREKGAAIEGALTLAKFGWQMTYQSRDKTEDIEQARGIIAGVDKSINAQIRGLGEGAAQHEAITAHRGLSNKLSDYRREQREKAAEEKAAGLESEGAALGAREQAAPRPTAADQALEYARSAAGVAGQIQKLETDSDRVAAVKGAVSLARFGWELAEKAGAGEEEQEQTRGIIDRAERALRFAINRIEDPQAKREAIQSRQTLYNEGVKEYREAKREAKRELALEKGLEKGAGIEPEV